MHITFISCLDHTFNCSNVFVSRYWFMSIVIYRRLLCHVTVFIVIICSCFMFLLSSCFLIIKCNILSFGGSTGVNMLLMVWSTNCGIWFQFGAMLSTFARGECDEHVFGNGHMGNRHRFQTLLVAQLSIDVLLHA